MVQQLDGLRPGTPWPGQSKFTPSLIFLADVAAYPGGAAVGAGVARLARQGVQHYSYVERDCHELVAEKEPGETVYPLAYEGRILQTASSIELSAVGEHMTVLQHVSPDLP